jgi:hypothetical protein
MRATGRVRAVLTEQLQAGAVGLSVGAAATGNQHQPSLHVATCLFFLCRMRYAFTNALNNVCRMVCAFQDLCSFPVVAAVLCW